MTIPATSRVSPIYQGNASATSFAFSYKTYLRSEVSVIVSDGLSPSTLVLDVDYTVTLNADQVATPGGTVLYPISGSPLPAGKTLVIVSAVPNSQNVALPTGGAFNAGSVELGLDRLQVQLQQFGDTLARTVRVPPGESLTASLPSALVRAGYLLGFDGTGALAIIAAAAQSASALALSLLSNVGSTLVNFLQPIGSGSGLRTVQDKLSERVSVADKLPAGVTAATATKAQAAAALTSALASGAKRVYISQAYNVTLTNGSFTVPAGVILDFDGGSLTFDAATTTINGLVYVNGANVKILDPVIDCTAVSVAPTGINCQDAPGTKIRDPLLTKCNINLQSSNAATRMGYQIIGGVINAAAGQTTIYVSAVKGALIMGVEMFGAKEGLGIYNGSSGVREVACESYGHTQDGSVIINGNKIIHVANWHHDNAQSGFTTQRQTAATNCQDVAMVANLASANTFDGLDLRGANSVSWGVDMRMTIVGNVSSGNVGTGAYVVYAEGTVLVGNVTGGNTLQGLFVNGSARVSAVGHYSGSNSNGVAAGASKAGILFQDSVSGCSVGSISTNSAGATQQYGISFTGTSANCSVAGGYYENNTSGPYSLSGNGAYFVGAAVQTVGNVWMNSLTGNTGATDETGFGVPTHSRVKGSIFRRTDGANGEVYICNGGTSWTIR